MTNSTPNSTEPSRLLRQIAAPDWLYQAWRKVRANRGAAGSDAIHIAAFEKKLSEHLTELSRNLINRTYQPLPNRWVNISKPNGTQRELGIPTVRDRVAQRAVLDAIEPVFERQFLDCSFAFRQGRSIQTAIHHLVIARAQGYVWTVDADILDFFPSVDHSLLCAEVSQTLDDPDLLKLIRLWLEAGAMEPQSSTQMGMLERCQSTIARARLGLSDTLGSMADEYVNDRLGVPAMGFEPEIMETLDPQSETVALAESTVTKRRQALLRRFVENGVVGALAERALVSRLALPVLGIGGVAAVALTVAPLVYRAIQSRGSSSQGIVQGSPISPLLSNIYLHPVDQVLTEKGMRFIRYCDDFVIAAQTKTEATNALRLVRQSLKQRHLGLHPEKTRIVGPGEAFDFLGYHFAADGSIVPPATLPAVVAQTIAHHSGNAVTTTRRTVAGWLGQLASKIGGTE